jgi:diaminohydroxyphosphoribosylaminopyrimidine deaminase/5-amino-6-(5-phosphoribosylamino)uracil reductase
VTDRDWMEQALALGAHGEVDTSPNPRVGCVVVRDGSVVGRGFHKAPGLPHAEALALRDAGELSRGATLYVSLEPCAHHGRTPPCADAIVASGIVRVVAALQDPNPIVDGRGFDRLLAAGVAVEIGLLGEDSRRMNDAFVHFHRTGRPLVTLKAAASLDGMLSAAGGRSRWISGAASRRFAHRLRLRHDAVLVGAGTARRDDPRLTVRLPGIRAPRRRCVIAPRLDLDPGGRLFQRADGQPPPKLYVGDGVDRETEGRFAGLADVVRVRARGEGLDLDEVLQDLAREGVHSILVEGGAKTYASFLDARRADRLALFVAGMLLGARGGTPLLDRPTVVEPAAGWRFENARQLSLGADLALVGSLRPPDGAGN